MSWSVVLLALAAGTAACAAPATSSIPSVASPAFEFARTAWRAEAIDGRPLIVGAAPRLTFDAREGATGSGAAFGGCTSFGFDWALDAGHAAIRTPSVERGTCPGIAGEIEAAFLARLAPATEYSIAGDVLTLKGPAGQIQLRRDVPPVGDPGRAVLELLRGGDWNVITVPGIPAVQFTDTHIVAVGECGFSGDFRMLPQGLVRFADIGWDSAGGCGPGRVALRRLLETVTSARIGADGRSVVFSGPNGEIVLGR